MTMQGLQKRIPKQMPWFSDIHAVQRGKLTLQNQGDARKSRRYNDNHNRLHQYEKGTPLNNPYSAPIAAIEEREPDEAALTYQPNFFALNGRINRLRYWAYNTGAIGIAFIITMALLFIVPATREQVLKGNSPGELYEYLLQIPIIIANLIMVRRRLQDIELSPWFMFIVLIPYIGRVFSLVLSFKKGSEGRNEYGPAPAHNTVGVWIGALALPVLIVLAIAGYAMFKTQIEAFTAHSQTDD